MDDLIKALERAALSELRELAKTSRELSDEELRKAGRWEETKHPRGQGGQFGSGGSGGGQLRAKPGQRLAPPIPGPGGRPNPNQSPGPQGGPVKGAPKPPPGPTPGGGPQRDEGAPLGAKVVSAMRDKLRAGGLSQEEVQGLVDKMRETYRATGDLEFPPEAKQAGIRGSSPAQWRRTVRAITDEFEQRKAARAGGPKATGEVPVVDTQAPHYAVAKAADAKRFTLGPFYVPDRLDAHDEWASSEDLQQGVWDYVRKGYRDIHLQHTKKRAGEWVEIVSWPYETEVELVVPGDEMNKATVRKAQFPEGTAYMGVVWEPWAWDLIKAGKLRGLSMGGFAQRVEVDFAPGLTKAAPEEEDPFDALFGPEAATTGTQAAMTGTQADPAAAPAAAAPEGDVPPGESGDASLENPPPGAPEDAPPDEAAPPGVPPGPDANPAVDEADARREAAAQQRSSAMWAGVEAAWSRYLEAEGVGGELAKSEDAEHPFLDLLDDRARDVLVRDAANWLATGPTPGRMLEIAELAGEDLTKGQLQALLGLQGDEAFDLLILGAVELFGGHTVDEAIQRGPDDDAPDEFDMLGEDEATAEDEGEVGLDQAAGEQDQTDAPVADAENAAEDAAPDEEVPEDAAPVDPKKKKPNPFAKFSEDQPRDADGKWTSGGATGTYSGNAAAAQGMVGANAVAGYGSAAVTGPSVPDTANPLGEFGTRDEHFNGPEAKAELGSALESAGFKSSGENRWSNEFGESIEVRSDSDTSVTVTERDSNGNPTRSERYESMADFKASPVHSRIAIESAMWSDLHQGDPVLVKVARAVREFFKYSDDQPRDESGKWTDGGGGPPLADSGAPSGEVPLAQTEGGFTVAAHAREACEKLESGPDPRDTAGVRERLDHVAEVMQQAEDDGTTTDHLFEHHPTAPNMWDIERQALQFEWVEMKMAEAEDVPHDKQAIIMGGLPGAGKTTFLNSDAATEVGLDVSQFVTINPDDAKEFLAINDAVPAYDDLKPMEAAGAVHEESSHMAQVAMDRVLASGANVIYDFTLSSESSGMKKLAAMKEAGYTVTMLYVDTTPDVSLERATRRYVGGSEEEPELGGRVAQFNALASIQPNEQGLTPNRMAFEALKDDVDGFVLVDNNSGPVVLETGGNVAA